MSATDHVILYVDDERPNRIVFEQCFGRAFKVHTVASGADALEYLRANPVGILVTDQRMPGMSGNELLTRVTELYPDIIRVAITAYSDLDPILRAVNDGLVARYIVKPWDRAELEQILAWGLEAFDLGRANSALQLRLIQTERLVTLGSIGAAVMHDVAQPLSFLMSNSERLAQLSPAAPELATLVANHGAELAPEPRQKLAHLAEELPDIVRDMLEGCRLMHDLTSSIRRLLRPSPRSEPQATEPVGVVRYALSVCRDIALTARATLIYDGPPSAARLRIGSSELSQVLINLVANATQALSRRATPGGRVAVRLAEAGDQLLIIIKDDGPGMSEDVLRQIGTPFFTTRPDGTGLGVAQCRRLVGREGGEVRIESREGEGTTVTVALPKA